jgi:conjugal transfer pilus assembly protein TraB
VLEKIKVQQYTLLYVLIGVLTLVLSIVCWMLFNTKQKLSVQPVSAKKHLTSAVGRINPQEVWMYEFNQKTELTQKRLESLEKTLEQLLKINTTAKPVKEITEQHSVEDLRKDLQALAHTDIHVTAEPIIGEPLKDTKSVATHMDPQVFLASGNNIKQTELKRINLNLQHSQDYKSLKTVDNTIPAGTFVEAILLGGVDASTAIQAASDPRPVLLRLIHNGVLPRKFQSDLHGCHVLAACYGDLSSERVFMRLEKMSCVERKTGEVLEMNLQGYVAGEDGRAGLRGAIVDRAGPMMRNAMVGGFFGSFGKFLGQSRSPFLFSPNSGLSQSNSLSSMDAIKQSAGQGMGGALDKYADFYIKRAEQMQPIIQVAAGRRADIVLTQGLDFASSVLRQNLSRANDQQRLLQMQGHDQPKPLQYWSAQQEGS